MPGGSAFTPAQNRTPYLHAKPVRNRRLYRAGRYSARHTDVAGLAGFHAGRQPNTLPEQDSGKGPVTVPDRPAQSPAPPVPNANTGKTVSNKILSSRELLVKCLAIMGGRIGKRK
jgi:hypothetical protein